MAHEVTFLVAVRIAQDEPDILSRHYVAGWVMGVLHDDSARAVDVTVWDSLDDLKADEREGKLESWVAEPYPATKGE
jgi:hypothetical protein